MMSTEKRGPDLLVGWESGGGLIEEIKCELRHKEARSVKGLRSRGRCTKPCRFEEHGTFEAL